MQAMKRAREFAAELRGVYGEELLSAVLYGSAARGDYREGLSDLNLLVILRATDAATLRRGTKLAREWASEGNPPPLMFSEQEWRASADVFPIEYEDMRDAHVLLDGSDPFTGLEIHWEHLRLQVEHELKSKHIQLREHFLLHADDADGLGTLLTRALPTFLTLFRAALHLAGEVAPRDPGATIAAIARHAGFDPRPLDEVQRARAEGGKITVAGDGPVLAGFLQAVQRTTHWLDGLAEPPSPRTATV